MLFQMVSKFGENLVERGMINELGFIDVAAAVCFVIDINGNLLRVDKLNVKKEERKLIPIAIYSKSFSDAEEKKRECTHSLFEHLYVQKEEAVQKVYYENLNKLALFVNDEKLNSIQKFIVTNDLYNLASQAEVTDEKGYFCVVVENDNEMYEIWKDEKITKRIGTFLLKECMTGEGKETDIFGRTIGRQITKHSRVLGSGSIRARMISQKIYNKFYGGNEEDNERACVVGSLSEIYFNYGLKVIKDSGQIFAGRYIYIGDINSNFYISLKWNMWDFLSSYGYSVTDEQSWQKFKEEFMELVSTKRLFFVAFDNINKGRVSTYRSIQFDIQETQKIICNILRWIEKTTIFKARFSWHTYTYMRIISSKQTNYEKGDSFLCMVENVMEGSFGKVWEKYVVPVIVEAIRVADRQMFNNALKISAQILEEEKEKMNIWEDDNSIFDTNVSVSYIGGAYLACVYLLEKKFDKDYKMDPERMTLAEKKCERFRMYPYDEMIVFRDEIEKRFRKIKYDKRYQYSVLLEKMKLLQTAMINKKEAISRKLSGEMYVAFDVTIRQYWNYVKQMNCLDDEQKEEVQDGV